jgi:cytoskeleton protein RodZ
MNVGATLRARREQLKLSLDQLARTTKISLATLRAIEDNEIERLPGGIFTRGFLRAYAREVGLDSDETVTRYLAQFGVASDNGEAGLTATEDTHAAPIRLIHGETDIVDGAGRRVTNIRLLLASLALAIGLAGYLTVGTPNTPLAPPSERPLGLFTDDGAAFSVPSPLPGQRPEAATSGSDDANARVAQGHDAIDLDIRTQGPCWVSVTADGITVAYRLMQAGERQVIGAREEVVLRVGDPAAFTFQINEMPGRPLGRAGQPITVRITTQNYHEFVSS